MRLASGRLLLWFGLATLLPALALVWVAWAVLEQGQLEERERAARLAAGRMQDVLGQLQRDLIEAATEGQVLDEPPRDTAVVVFTAAGTATCRGRPLAYLPAGPPMDVDVFGEGRELAAIDDLEYRRGDLRGAAAALELLTGSLPLRVRGDALLRLARVRWRLGNTAAALKALDVLESLDTSAGGLPAGLAAQQLRLDLLEEAGRHADRRMRAARLRNDLAAGRWPISEAQFEIARARIGADEAGVLEAPATLAAAASVVWDRWRRGGTFEPVTAIPIAPDTTVIAIARHDSAGVATLLIPAAAIVHRWATDDAAVRPFRMAFADANGRLVVGDAEALAPPRTTLPAASPGLPWTLHVAPRDPGVFGAPVSARARLTLAGIAIMLLVVGASGYAINRAMSREMAVARLQSDFVNAVSHEFRTPLTTIRQLSEMLARSRVSTEGRKHEFYDTLVGESERLQRLVETLLDFGKMDAGRFEYRFAPVDVLPLVRDVAAGVERAAAERGGAITVAGADDLPPVRGDRESLAHVFRNLLDNAVKYSPDRPIVSVAVSNGHGRVAIAVRDRGAGIPADEQPRIFGKFVRGSAAATAGVTGTGIGLALAQEIVRAHGGEILVESAVGAGSTFRVHLPLAERGPAAP